MGQKHRISASVFLHLHRSTTTTTTTTIIINNIYFSKIMLPKRSKDTDKNMATNT